MEAQDKRIKEVLKISAFTLTLFQFLREMLFILRVPVCHMRLYYTKCPNFSRPFPFITYNKQLTFASTEHNALPKLKIFH